MGDVSCWPAEAHHTNELIALITESSRPLEPLPTRRTPRLSVLAGIRAVLFDVYGTLVISASGDVGLSSSRGRTAAMTTALESIAHDVREDRIDDWLARFDALIDDDHARLRAAGEEYPEVEIRSVWSRLLTTGGRDLTRPEIESAALVFELGVNPVWPMPEASSLLATLSACGYPCGIVSNAQFYTPLLFPALFGASHQTLGIDERLCAWSYRLCRAKPSHRMFEGPLSVLATARGIEASEVLYVGNDCLNDVATAQRAGCRTALFAGDARSLRLRPHHPSCHQVVADVELTCLSQLLQVLDHGQLSRSADAT